MRRPISFIFLPTVQLKEEFRNPGFGTEIEAELPVAICAVYPTNAATTSVEAEGSTYSMVFFSTLDVKFSKCPERPLCDAACDKEALQASLYLGSEFKHKATIKGVSVIRTGYQYVVN